MIQSRKRPMDDADESISSKRARLIACAPLVMSRPLVAPTAALLRPTAPTPLLSLPAPVPTSMEAQIAKIENQLHQLLMTVDSMAGLIGPMYQTYLQQQQRWQEHQWSYFT